MRGLLVFLWVAAAVACSSDPQAAARKYIARAHEHLAAGRLPDAIIEYRNAIQRDPLAADARVKLADAYMAAREYSGATEEYVRAADLKPEDTDLQLKAGRLLFLAGRFNDSKSIAEKVIARDGSHAEAQTLLANSLAGLKDFDSAIAEIEDVINLNPAQAGAYSNLGALHLGRGEKKAAEAAFKKAVDLEPGSAVAHLALANFYWVDNRREPAEAHLRTVLQIDSKNVLAHRALAILYNSTNRRPEAEKHLKEVVELTGAPAASLALAEFYLTEGNRTSAREALRPLAENPATNATAEARLAMLDHAEGRGPEAYGRLESVLGRQNAQLDALLARTNLLLSDRRFDEALSDATLATEKHPTSAEAQFALGRVQTARRQREAAMGAYEAALRLNPQALGVKLALAQLHLSAGRVEAALSLTREVVSSQPQNPEARLTASRAMLGRRDLRGAEQELSALVKAFPDSTEVHVQLGLLNRLQRNESAARRHFERALAIRPASAEAFGGLVALDVDAKRVGDARARLEQRLAAYGDDPATLLLAARAFATLGDAPKAEDTLRHAIQVDPNLLEAYNQLVQLLVNERRLDAAIVEADRWAKHDPRPAAALTLAGIILQVQGQAEGATQRFERAIESDPEAAVAANNLAWIYASSGRNLDTALQLAQTARRHLPDDLSVTNTLGFVYFKKDLLVLAIPELKACVERAPDNPTYNHHLGLAYAKAGDRPQAVRHLRRALQLNGDFEGAGEAGALLKTLEPGQGD